MVGFLPNIIKGFEALSAFFGGAVMSKALAFAGRLSLVGTLALALNDAFKNLRETGFGGVVDRWKEVGDELLGVFQKIVDVMPKWLLNVDHLKRQIEGLKDLSGAIDIKLDLPKVLSRLKDLGGAFNLKLDLSGFTSGTRIIEHFKTAFESVSNAIKGIYESQWGWLLPGGALVKGILFLQDKWGTVWGHIEDAFSTSVDALTAAGGTLKDFFSGLFAGVADGFKAALNGVISGFNSALDVAAKLIRLTKEALDKIIPGPNPAGNFLTDVASQLEKGIPKLDQGGIMMRPSLAPLTGNRRLDRFNQMPPALE